MISRVSDAKLDAFYAEVGDLVRTPEVQKMKQFHHHGTMTCYNHSMFVAYLSFSLARKWGWDVDWRSLVRGALLHDYFLYNWREHNDDHRLHGFYHARRAMENAERDFGLNPIEANIIHRHMFPLNPTPPKYKESVVVTCADKICATREVWSCVRIASWRAFKLLTAYQIGRASCRERV